MSVREVIASGPEYLAMATGLLQRARLADAEAGLWEAADLQWWWRKPRGSDAIDQRFWVDDEGPVAAAVLTDWGDTWTCDPILTPGAPSAVLGRVWERAMQATESLRLEVVDVLARDDDRELVELLSASAFVAGEDKAGITWMRAEDRPVVASLPNSFKLVDRSQPANRPHPMRRRSGDVVEARLRECSLYDPSLDLAVETHDGQTAGYALFWFDPVTEVGMVEPMRVEEPYQRRGLARALLSAGLDRLAGRGARRLKVGYGSEAARRLYVGAGFTPKATTTVYRRRHEA